MDHATLKFEAGKTYQTRSICDSDCIVSITVLSRTAKTIKAKTVKAPNGQTFRISEWDGAESVRPWGSYSMCPIIRATDEKVAA